MIPHREHLDMYVFLMQLKLFSNINPLLKHCLLHLLTFAFFSKGQGGWNSNFPFLSRTHIYHADIEALDDLSDAQHKPLRVSGSV